MGYNTKIKIDNGHVEQLSGSSLTFSGDSTIAASGSMSYAVHPSSFTDLELVDKCYVDGASGAIGGANGLSRQSDNIVLGGTLTGATTITAGEFNFFIESGGSSNYNFQMSPTADVFNLYSNGGACVVVDGGSDQTYLRDSTGAYLDLSTGNAAICNAASASGIETKDDILCLTGRPWIVSTLSGGSSCDLILVKDVDSSGEVKTLTTSSLNATACNGLHASNNNVMLGGALTGNTTISGAQTLNFNVSAVNITGATAIKSSTLTLNTVVAGATTNPIMVLDAGVVKCVPASNYNVTAANGITALSNNKVVLGGALTGLTTISGAQTLCLSSLTAFRANATNIALTGIVGVTGAATFSSTVTHTTTAAGVSTNPIMVLDSGVVKCVPASCYVTSANNGLNKINGNVRLGGALTGNTTINGAASYGLTFNSSPLFAVNATTVNLTGSTTNIGGCVSLATTPSGTGTLLCRDATTGQVKLTSLAAFGGITGATNGLTDCGSQRLGLGGALCANTCLTGAYNFQALDLNGVCLSTLNVNDIALNSKSNGGIYLQSQAGTTAASNNVTNAIGIQMDYDNVFQIFDGRAGVAAKGICYAADYSLNYVDRSLVDKAYVDSVATGLQAHATVLVATTGATVLSGLTIVDGVQLVGADRVLVKNQGDGTTNGIYSASTGVWGRTSDYDFLPTGEVSNGDLIPVSSGNTNASSIWILTTPDPIVSGVTSLEYSVFSKFVNVTGGDGIAVTTVGTNRSIAVDLVASNCGLCFSGNKLAADRGIYSSGLTVSGVGVVTVNASNCGAIGTCIPVLFDSNCFLVVDKDDFSYTCGANGLSKVGCNVVLGGSMTGATTISMAGSTGLAFTDTRSITCGLQYSGAYKAGFTIHSLVDKDFVTGLTTGLVSANNGITASANNVYLGGALTGNTLITNADTHSFSIFDSGNGGLKVDSQGGVTLNDSACGAATDWLTVSDQYTLNAGAIGLMSIVTAGGLVGGVISGIHISAADTQCVVIDAVNGGNLRIGSTCNSFTDGRTGTKPGLEYTACYHADYTQRSLVDKEYVTSQTSGITGTVTSVTATTTTTGTDISVSVADSTTTPAITLCIPTASAANRGALSTADWTTFNNKTTCVGTVTSVGTTGPLTGTVTTSGNLSINQATTSTDGYLSQTDWNTFNGKTTCTGTITGGINGLSISGVNLKLGGALTGDTTISGAHTLCLSSLTAFNATATNINLIGAVKATSTLGVTGATQIGGTLGVTGVLTTTTTATIGGALTLSSVGVGSVSDSVLTVTAGGVVQKISSSALGEDNNLYATSGTTSGITLTDTYYAVMANSTGGSFTITLPAAPAVGQAYKIKDSGLDALSNNITISGNGNNIDGVGTATINTDGGALEVVWDGTQWNVLSFVN